MEKKVSRIAETILKEKVERIMLSNFKIYYVVNSNQDTGNGEETDTKNRIESPDKSIQDF